MSRLTLEILKLQVDVPGRRLERVDLGLDDRYFVLGHAAVTGHGSAGHSLTPPDNSGHPWPSSDVEICQIFTPGVAVLVCSWARFVPNGENLGLFKISFLFILARGAKMKRKLILKSHRLAGEPK